MSRLTTHIRKKIIEQLIKHTFEKERIKLDKVRKGLALKIYNSLYPPEVQQKMSELPLGFFISRGRLEINEFGEYSQFAFEDNLRRPFSYEHSGCVKIDPNSPVRLELKTWCEELKQLRIKEYAAVEMAESILKSKTTIEALVKIWPEVAPFVPKETPSTAVGFPLEQINAAFKLHKVEG